MKNLKYVFCTLIISTTIYPHKKRLNQKMIVRSSVANLRSEPKDIPTGLTLPSSSKTNPLQLTQLLYNEYVIAHKKYTDQEHTEWYQVEAVQQLNKNIDNSWSGINGWAKAQDLNPVEKFEQHNLVVTNLFAPIFTKQGTITTQLCIGTQLTGTLNVQDHTYHIQLPDRTYGYIHMDDVTPIQSLHGLTEQDVRNNIVEIAEKFLGNLYSWGGRTPQNKNWPVSSVDCSGLVNLTFAAQGLLIPRNSKTQYLKTNHIKHGKDLQAGDLIFFATSDQKISHVLIYDGHGNVIESSLTAGKVQKIPFKKRIGIDHTLMKSGDRSGPIKVCNSEHPTYFTLYFGSFLSQKNLVKKLRNDFLRHNY